MDAKPNGGPAEAYPSQCQHEVIAWLKKEFNHQISASSVSEILSDYYLFLDQDIPFLPPPSPQCTGLWTGQPLKKSRITGNKSSKTGVEL